MLISKRIYQRGYYQFLEIKKHLNETNTHVTKYLELLCSMEKAYNKEEHKENFKLDQNYKSTYNATIESLKKIQTTIL